MGIVVIKWGSFDPDTSGPTNKGVVRDILKLKESVRPVILHGGGKKISEVLSEAGIKSQFVQGHRVTDEATAKVVEMVLSGKVNKGIVGLINATGGRAVGISGKDANLIVAKKKPSQIPLGFTGVVKEIHPEILHLLVKNNIIPVISPVSADSRGKTYNINADSVAAEIVIALKAQWLIFLSNVPGVLARVDDKSSLLPVARISQIDNLVRQKKINAGMLPKLQACKKALDAGVKYVHIVDGKEKGVLKKLLAGKKIGTRVIG